jgi:hypothetical protein
MLPEESKIDEDKFNEIDEFLREYLEQHNYLVERFLGGEGRGTYTYVCSVLGIYFYIKLCILSTASPQEINQKRQRRIENEIQALDTLWEIADKRGEDEGEMKSFVLPPGIESVFDDDIEDIRIYGYARLFLDGENLAKQLREENIKLNKWPQKLAAIVLEIDSLKDLDLPRNDVNSQKDFQEIIINNTRQWKSKLQEIFSQGKIEGVDEKFKSYMEQVSVDTVNFFKQNEPILGTVHGDLTPEHILTSQFRQKPYIVNFTHFSENYPRFFDAALLYSWMVVVWGNSQIAQDFWSEVTEDMDFDNRARLEMLTNEILLATLYSYLTKEEKVVKMTWEDFWF